MAFIQPFSKTLLRLAMKDRCRFIILAIFTISTIIRLLTRAKKIKSVMAIKIMEEYPRYLHPANRARNWEHLYFCNSRNYTSTFEVSIVAVTTINVIRILKFMTLAKKHEKNLAKFSLLYFSVLEFFFPLHPHLLLH